MLEDAHGRAVSGVRISLTDRCNFNCVYCHNEGLGDTRGPLDPQDEEMEAADVIRFLEVVEEYDVRKVKFTGGEPMLRSDLEAIIAGVPDSMEVSMTTNGTYLPGRAADLKTAGLQRVNISRTRWTVRRSTGSPSPVRTSRCSGASRRPSRPASPR